MLNIRVIPNLLLNGSSLVKGQNFKNHKYVGDPINAVKIFNVKEVDELIFFDITATIEKREINFNLLKDVASEAFMPLGYGGGINNLNQIEKLFYIGFEKVIINTSCYKKPNLIKGAVEIAGSQSIVACIDVKKTLFKSPTVFVESGKKNTKENPVDYAKKMVDLGVGEIIINSIDYEGLGAGYDYALIKEISDAVSVPVVASGGAGKLADFKNAITSGASAVTAGDIFIYHGKHRAVLITYPEYSKLENLFKE